MELKWKLLVRLTIARVDIGLRLDLRKFINRNRKPILAATVLSTIVYALEDRIDGEQMKKHRVSDIPKLQPKTTETTAT